MLLYGAVATRLGEVVRFFSAARPWSVADDAGVMRVCLGASELDDFPIGTCLLLRVRAEEVPYLNLIRPYFGERKLRTVLWAEDAVVDTLLARGPDLVSWIYRQAEVPPRRWPEFAEAGVRVAIAAGVPFAWDGEQDELEALLGDVGWASGTVGLRASMSFREMLRALERPGLPLMEGMRRDVDAWRVRMALARAGRVGAWVALRPARVPAGMWRLHARQADWEEATKRLREAGWKHAGTMAAWVDLEPERIEQAAGRVGQPPAEASAWAPERVAVGDAPGYVLRERIGGEDVAVARERIRSGPIPREEAAIAVWSEGAEPWDGDPGGGVEARLVRCLRCLGEQTPASGSVDAAADAGLTDVAAELARIRFEHEVNPRADLAIRWLVQYGEVEAAYRLAQAWVERARGANDEESLAAALTWLGDLQRALGNGERALHYYQDVLAIQKVLFEREPDRADLLRDLSLSHNKLGDLERALGNGEQALRQYEEGLVMARSLVEQEPDRADLLHGLSICYERLGDLERALGNGEQALRYVEDALAIRRALVERMPNNADLQRDISVAYDKLGELHITLGNRDQALAYLEYALAIDRSLLVREPGRSDLQRDLFVSYERLGDLQRTLGSGEQALRYYEDALAIARSLVKQEPGRTDLQEDLATSYERLGDLHSALGNEEQARRHYEDALAIRRTLVEQQPNIADLQRDLSASYDRLGGLHLTRGNGEQARHYFEAALAIDRALAEREPGRADLQRDLSSSLQHLGDVERALGNQEQARRCYEDALAIARALVEREPARSDLQGGLAIAYERMATVEPENASTWLRDAIAIHHRRVTIDPRNVMTQRELAIVLIQLAKASGSQGDHQTATDSLHEAYALLRPLRDSGALEAQYHPLVDELARRISG